VAHSLAHFSRFFIFPPIFKIKLKHKTKQLSSSRLLKNIFSLLNLIRFFSIAYLFRFTSTYKFNMPPYSFSFLAVLFVILFSRPLIHFILSIRFIRFKTLLISSVIVLAFSCCGPHYSICYLFLCLSCLLHVCVYCLSSSLFVLSCLLCFCCSCLSSFFYVIQLTCLLTHHIYTEHLFITPKQHIPKDQY
jgi:hypothetical protein